MVTKVTHEIVSSTDSFTFGNVVLTGNVTASHFNYANGQSILSGITAGGGGGLDNLDGGTPYSVYGGLTAIDGGGVT